RNVRTRTASSPQCERMWLARTGAEIVVVEETEIPMRHLGAENRLNRLRQQDDVAVAIAYRQVRGLARLFGGIAGESRLGSDGGDLVGEPPRAGLAQQRMVGHGLGRCRWFEVARAKDCGCRERERRVPILIAWCEAGGGEVRQGLPPRQELDSSAGRGNCQNLETSVHDGNRSTFDWRPAQRQIALRHEAAMSSHVVRDLLRDPAAVKVLGAELFQAAQRRRQLRLPE